MYPDARKPANLARAAFRFIHNIGNGWTAATHYNTQVKRYIAQNGDSEEQSRICPICQTAEGNAEHCLLRCKGKYKHANFQDQIILPVLRMIEAEINNIPTKILQ